MPGLALGIHQPFHHHLGSDTGVVGTGLPQGLVAFHTMKADQGIHDGVLEGVAHMQAAGNIRRWNHDAVAIVAVGLLRGVEVSALFPSLVPALLQVLWIVGFFHRSIQNVSVCGSLW